MIPILSTYNRRSAILILITIAVIVISIYRIIYEAIQGLSIEATVTGISLIVAMIFIALGFIANQELEQLEESKYKYRIAIPTLGIIPKEGDFIPGEPVILLAGEYSFVDEGVEKPQSFVVCEAKNYNLSTGFVLNAKRTDKRFILRPNTDLLVPQIENKFYLNGTIIQTDERVLETRVDPHRHDTKMMILTAQVKTLSRKVTDLTDLSEKYYDEWIKMKNEVFVITDDSYSKAALVREKTNIPFGNGTSTELQMKKASRGLGDDAIKEYRNEVKSLKKAVDKISESMNHVR